MTAVATDRDRNPRPSPQPVDVGELRPIPLDQLVESPWNPRKHFDPAKLAEMADSLRKGQLAPIIVRPIAGKHERYEIGAGHRRYRAAPQAGLTSLLAIIRDMDDVTFLELLTIENKQRDDVTPLDEANGFRLLMEKAGYDVAKLAARIGLSTKYVYDRLKLLQLVPAAKKLLEDGTITAGHAILLARLTPTQQKSVIGKASANRYAFNSGGLFEYENTDEGVDGQGRLKLRESVKARSVRELATYINDHIRLPPEAIDPFLFPETAETLKAAQEEEEKVVHITYDGSTRVEARDAKQRTYSVISWKRADGKNGSKTCDYSCMGVVVAGPSRGDALRVCVNRDKCETHFGAAKRKLKRDRARYGMGSNSPSSNDDYWEKERKRQAAAEARRKASNARWEKAAPTLLDALAKAMKKLPAGAASAIGKYLINDTDAMPYDHGIATKYLPIGTTAEQLVRHIVFAHLAGDIEEPYDEGKHTIQNFKTFGINATKILDQVAPKPKPEKKAAPKKAKKKGSR